MKIAFITAGPIEWASSRLRAFWVADELMKRGHFVASGGMNTPVIELAGYDVYIWQKQVITSFVNENSNARHYWDVCDPMWWFSPDYVRGIVEVIDGIVFSSQALQDDFEAWGVEEFGKLPPLYTIPDRLNLAHYPIQRKHEQTAVTRFIWFGIAANRQALYSALANLERLKANGYSIALTILDDRPDAQFTGVSFPVYHARWTLDTENEVIASHDIALLPPYPGPWGRVKSNNKTLTAWACGLPVTNGDDYHELSELVTSREKRNHAAKSGMLAIGNKYTIDKSADDWERILNE